ncbi:non-ribosomal peptide synthetase, partial [Paraburkholderia unamae]
LFDREAVEQLARHYRVILEAVAAEPQRRIGDLPLMGGAEQRAVLMDWNDTHIEWPAPAPTLAEAFEAQVRLTPDAIAVSFDREPNHEPLTYGALNARANRLAHHLREHGVGPDRLVAVCMERSVDMIVALLGVLKAGGAYVPLDPAYPAERLAYLLGDTAAAVLITQSHLPCAPHLQHAQTVYLDGYETAFAYAPDHNPAGVCTSSHLAYCIYTSGSTGNPKGALNTHGAIVNRLLWMQHEYGLGPNDTVLQKTPFTFDVSVWEFFWPLLNGARLVIAKPEGHKDPAYLADAIQRHRVTTLHFVPSMLQAFLNAGMHLTQHALRQVFCSGEALPCALQQQFHRHFNPVKLHNLYGPTEAAVDVTFWHCEPGGDPTAASVPIGRPVANTRMYVLDGELRPVPPGVEGDLFIGGVQLARGYLKRPGLTAEKFIPNPYGVVGSRLYRTGDRARYRRDGVLEFLGRSDDQVKLRGLRIEPGEIENALQAHPDVLAAAVAVKGGTQGELYEAQLVGYVVMRAGRSLDNAALRAHLLQCLPDYMVPGIWMCLDALPLNANGKLERKRLPEPDGASREASVNGTPYVAPRTPTETMLATLWAELLGVERVGIDDNFFELGGHSLLATQVIARLTDCFPRALTMRTLFDSPTIAAIARVLDAEPSTEGNRIRRMPAIQRQKRIGETQSIQ